MNSKQTEADYVPYGPEWEKEMSKFPKPKLIKMLGKAYQEKKELKQSLPSKPVGDVEEMATMIVSAFPGTGKSYFVEHSGLKCLDSDSSKFDKSNFPWNYIEYIRDNIGKYEYIFVSSHQEVRDALVASGMSFLCVYPDISCRREYLQRYKERGNDEKFINLIDNNWQDWIEDIASSHIIPSIKLTKGIYVSDIFKSGYAAAPQKGMNLQPVRKFIQFVSDKEAHFVRSNIAEFWYIKGRSDTPTTEEFLKEFQLSCPDESPSPSEAGDGISDADFEFMRECDFFPTSIGAKVLTEDSEGAYLDKADLIKLSGILLKYANTLTS